LQISIHCNCTIFFLTQMICKVSIFFAVAVFLLSLLWQRWAATDGGPATLPIASADAGQLPHVRTIQWHGRGARGFVRPVVKGGGGQPVIIAGSAVTRWPAVACVFGRAP
jgi:hypothetical protein